MKDDGDALWTIDELGERTAQALAVDYEGPPNDRVRDVPDRRTIRYYSTLGLIDRPSAMRGRTALYGKRHLLQLVAIKRLQARGLSLAGVQQQLLGLTDSALARLARLPAGIDRAADAKPGTGPKRPLAERRQRASAFWKAEPAPAPTRSKSIGDRPPPARPLQGVWLRDEVTLLLAAGRPLDDDDVRTIRGAAETLIRHLEARGLIAPREERSPR